MAASITSSDAAPAPVLASPVAPVAVVAPVVASSPMIRLSDTDRFADVSASITHERMAPSTRRCRLTDFGKRDTIGSRKEALEVLRSRLLESRGEYMGEFILKMRAAAEPIGRLLAEFPTAFIAGGFCSALFDIALMSIAPTKWDVIVGDVDVYFRDDTPAASTEPRVARDEALRFLKVVKPLGLRRSDFAVTLLSPSVAGHRISRTRQLFGATSCDIVGKCDHPLQIVLSRVASGLDGVAELLDSYDFGACQIALVGGEFYTTRIGIESLLWGENGISSLTSFKDTSSRLAKYAARGYDVVFPPEINVDFAGMDPTLFVEPGNFTYLLSAGRRGHTRGWYEQLSGRKAMLKRAGLYGTMPDEQYATAIRALSDSIHMVPTIIAAIDDLRIVDKTGKLIVFDFDMLLGGVAPVFGDDSDDDSENPDGKRSSAERKKLYERVLSDLLDGVYPLELIAQEIAEQLAGKLELLNRGLGIFGANALDASYMTGKARSIATVFAPLDKVRLLPPFGQSSKVACEKLGMSIDAAGWRRWCCLIDPSVQHTERRALEAIAVMSQGRLASYPILKALAKAAAAYLAGRPAIPLLEERLTRAGIIGERIHAIIPSLNALIGVGPSTALSEGACSLEEVDRYVTATAAPKTAAKSE